MIILQTQGYFAIFSFIIFSFCLSVFLYTLTLILINQKPNVDKLKAYECGFDAFNDARKPFDVRFYLIAILFIIFDLESVYLFPWVLTLDTNMSMGFWCMIEFLIELIVGFIYIWSVGCLEWH